MPLWKEGLPPRAAALPPARQPAEQDLWLFQLPVPAPLRLWTLLQQRARRGADERAVLRSVSGSRLAALVAGMKELSKIQRDHIDGMTDVERETAVLDWKRQIAYIAPSQSDAADQKREELDARIAYATRGGRS